MMTLAFALLAVNSFFLLRRKAPFGAMVAVAALVVGVIIFMGDVDFASDLGIQL